MNNVKLPSYDNCCGCGACIDACKHGALACVENKNGFRRIVINRHKCISCGACIRVCPINSITNNENYNLPNSYWAWTMNEPLRIKSTSGGVFAQIACDFIDNYGGIVIGAALIDGKSVKHICIDSTSDIENLQGSKYLQSDTSGIFRYAMEALNSGTKVLFSGTPCQIAGMKRFVEGRRNANNLYTVEVICHGIPSKCIFDFGLKINAQKSIKTFRDKSQNPWGTGCYLQYSESQCASGENIGFFYKAYFNDQYLRPACYNCKFAHLPRIADISLADGWGVNSEMVDKENIGKGISLILVNNQIGMSLIKSKYLNVLVAKWNDFLPYNPNIIQNNSYLKCISLSNFIYYILKYLSRSFARDFVSLSSKNDIKGIWVKPYILIILGVKKKLMKRYRKKKISNFLNMLNNEKC